ncbi:hypothetical protein PMIN06_011471 [Paraphaeosphaeria minitans]|uniref:HD domain-containing protein n=1 Tax=Paraphaeosphaeria minitans TaxID=565426 RepID=A0A9P6GB17_9PLEO|nr:HD domain-containing protein [Paraphaeosphaeria minitans]
MSSSLKNNPSLKASTLPASDDTTHTTNPFIPGGYANSSPSRNRLLFNMDKLEIPPQHRDMFLAVNKLVRDYMYGERYDPSHDYEHIQRVVKNAYELHTAEKAAGRLPPNLDVTTMYLAAMMHDVGETKYLEHGRTQEDVVKEKMLECGASSALAAAVATIAINVSYTRERNASDPNLINAILDMHPELAFVQDADRLDALGPSGQARCFVFGGANERRRVQSLHTGVQLQHTRFQWYAGMMKTKSGRDRGEIGWNWMKEFAREWAVDTDVACVL